jgi:hypothetical protein
MRVLVQGRGVLEDPRERKGDERNSTELAGKRADETLETLSAVLEGAV